MTMLLYVNVLSDHAIMMATQPDLLQFPDLVFMFLVNSMTHKVQTDWFEMGFPYSMFLVLYFSSI